MPGEPVIHPPERILEELGRLFLAPAADRHVYTVYGPYEQLRPFQKRLKEEAARGSFDNSMGRVEFLSVNRDLIAFIEDKGLGGKAGQLSAGGREDEMRRLLSDAFRDLITSRIEAPGTLGLIVADLELLYAYDLGNNALPLLRQVAINGKRVCLLVPGALRDGRLWIFDHDPESRREFPEPLLFLNSGWVFTFRGEAHPR
jgi:hypothetical protein